ncbi:MAG: ABC transporter permease, partial [Candidatus Acidiferrales bacterium]
MTAAALMIGMAVATATLTIALEVGDRLAREFRSLGANLLVTPESDTLPVEIGGVDYRPVDEGAYLSEADLGKLKTIFWRHNILGFTPFLDVPAYVSEIGGATTLIGTWYQHEVPVPDGTNFVTGASVTHPWWKVQGRWFRDDSEECVVGLSVAEKYPAAFSLGKTIHVTGGGVSGAGRSLVVTGIISTGDAEDNAVLAPLSVAQEMSNHPGK